MEIEFKEYHVPAKRFSDLESGQMFLTPHLPNTLCMKWDQSTLLRLDGTATGFETTELSRVVYAVSKLVVTYDVS